MSCHYSINGSTHISEIRSSRQISGPITIAVCRAYSSLKDANPQVDTCDSAESICYLDDMLAETHPCFPLPF